FFFFFFSSRRRHTRSDRDWSSDVCSSDLYHGWKYDVNGQCVDLPSEPEESGMRRGIKLKSYPAIERGDVVWIHMGPPELKPAPRSEERRVGKECRSRWARDQQKQKELRDR